MDLRQEELFEFSREEGMPSMRFFLSRAGQHGSLGAMTPELRGVAHATYREGVGLSQPRVAAAIASTDELPKHLIPDPLKGASRLSLFCATLGERLDAAVDLLFQRERPLEGALLDAWGSESVERLAQSADLRLRARYGGGSMRFSPGYGNFSVLYNIELLRLIAGVCPDIPIAASEQTGILTPRKSVLCMIGWGELFSRGRAAMADNQQGGS